MISPAPFRLALGPSIHFILGCGTSLALLGVLDTILLYLGWYFRAFWVYPVSGIFLGPSGYTK